ncbi:hypothetical protein Q5P01_013239 [Channa striata]|uniref:Uncharacterized protein n=1 Tax=Channa striata TaxID=64152 RepID=A0AA88MMH5_CHASR|nr:hypothetical protein Q5P01_013239 [Channa striata]
MQAGPLGSLAFLCTGLGKHDPLWTGCCARLSVSDFSCSLDVLQSHVAGLSILRIQQAARRVSAACGRSISWLVVSLRLGCSLEPQVMSLQRLPGSPAVKEKG